MTSDLSLLCSAGWPAFVLSSHKGFVAAQRRPLCSGTQDRSERWDNEALQILDVVVSACVEGPPMQVPPPNPAVGSTYIVAASPIGAWSAFAHHLAAFTQAGWRFIQPSAGLCTMIRTTGAMAVYRDGLWETGIVAGSKLVLDGEQVVGPRAAAISNPAGGTFVDAEAREAIFEILNRLRGHGLVA